MSVASTEMVKDLLRLGITPRKSLTIKFPQIPDEYAIHYIRGVFDGDGSITSGRLKIGSASKEFAYGLRQKLITILNIEPERVQLYEDIRIRSKLPQGEYNKPSGFYNVTICATLVLKKLYHLFYDNVGEDEYLERKKESFKKLVESKLLRIEKNLGHVT